MKSRIKRPPSVWLTQTLLLFCALLWLYSSAAVAAIHEIDSFTLALRIVLLVLGVVLLILIPFWGLAKRKMYGRWLSVSSLGLLWVYVLDGQLRELAGAPKPYHPREPGALVVLVILHLLINLFIVVLTLRLAFAKRVSEFFSQDIEST